jgi:hypothetical protein
MINDQELYPEISALPRIPDAIRSNRYSLVAEWTPSGG